MEEKTLDAQQSMELISRMIQTTRIHLERNSGRPSLVWGYTTVAVALFNYLVRATDMNPEWSFTWFLIPVAGWLLMLLIPGKKRTEPHTEVDRIIGAVWKSVSFAVIPAFAFALFHRADILALIALLMAIGTAATGLIVRSRIYTVAGFAGMALTMLFPLYDSILTRMPGEQLATGYLYIPILIFAAIFVVMMIIPGHIINRRSKHAQ